MNGCVADLFAFPIIILNSLLGDSIRLAFIKGFDKSASEGELKDYLSMRFLAFLELLMDTFNKPSCSLLSS